MTELEVKYNELIDKILKHFAGPQFKQEVQMAKNEFFSNAGSLDENADNFELRMSQFFDWYFFTRPLSGYGQTPLVSAFLERELRFAPEEVLVVDKLKQHRHSLFEFIKIKNSDVYIKDLFKNEKIVVKHSPLLFGFNEDEIFEARLLLADESYLFTRGFCFHPAEAKKYILKEVKKHRKNPDLSQKDFMLRLLKMRYKYERYRHVSVDKIYSEDNLMGL